MNLKLTRDASVEMNFLANVQIEMMYLFQIKIMFFEIDKCILSKWWNMLVQNSQLFLFKIENGICSKLRIAFVQNLELYLFKLENVFEVDKTHQCGNELVGNCPDWDDATRGPDRLNFLIFLKKEKGWKFFS